MELEQKSLGLHKGMRGSEGRGSRALMAGNEGVGDRGRAQGQGVSVGKGRV